MTADVPVVEVEAVDAVLDALDTPTSSEVYSAVEPFSNSAVAAAAAARALGAGGDGAAPGVGGVYACEATAVPANQTTALAWTFLYGTAQLGLTAPTAPLPLVAGVYALTVSLNIPTGFTAGKHIICGIDIDTDNNDAGVSFGGEVELFNLTSPIAFAGAVTFYTLTNSSMHASVSHDDVAARDVSFKAYVQRVA